MCNGQKVFAAYCSLFNWEIAQGTDRCCNSSLCDHTNHNLRVWQNLAREVCEVCYRSGVKCECEKQYKLHAAAVIVTLAKCTPRRI